MGIRMYGFHDETLTEPAKIITKGADGKEDTVANSAYSIWVM